MTDSTAVLDFQPSGPPISSAGHRPIGLPAPSYTWKALFLFDGQLHSWIKSVSSNPDNQRWDVDIPSGERELAWYLRNRQQLSGSFKNRWIAIRNQAVIASGTSFQQVYQVLVNEKINNALVQFVPSYPGADDTLVA